VKTPLACLAILSCTGLVEFKKGVILKALQAKAKAQTDLAAAQQMQRAKADLFELFNKPRPRRQARRRCPNSASHQPCEWLVAAAPLPDRGACVLCEKNARRRGASGCLAGAFENKTNTPIANPVDCFFSPVNLRNEKSSTQTAFRLIPGFENITLALSNVV
jgi:hypothetical protein